MLRLQHWPEWRWVGLFSPYIWQLYLSAGGTGTVRQFEAFFRDGVTQGYIRLIRTLRGGYQPDELQLQLDSSQLEDLMHDQEDGPDSDSPGTASKNAKDDSLAAPEDIREWGAALYRQFCDACGEDAKGAFAEFSGGLVYYSTLFALADPDRFVPYYFAYNYNVLQMVADAYGINLPAMPHKSDYYGRFYHYEKVCGALQEFRRENGLSAAGLCAFLYDFAPKSIGGVSSFIIPEESLPEARSAFFIGSARTDLFFTEDPAAVTPWQCSPDTRAGDWIVMYLTSPDSAAGYIWRSCSVGFVDPFFYYYRCAYICHPVKIRPVTLDRMRHDRILHQMNIVKKNMQGVNGVELRPREYNRIVTLGKKETLCLPVEEALEVDGCSTERDVEERIIKPLLARLGYAPEDYVQQLELRFGNQNRGLIPDFVLLPDRRGLHTRAFAVVEAKRSITLPQQLADALSQVRSYAKQLSAAWAAVVSREKLWLYTAGDDYEKPLLELRVRDISDDDLFALRKHIGRRQT